MGTIISSDWQFCLHFISTALPLISSHMWQSGAVFLHSGMILASSPDDASAEVSPGKSLSDPELLASGGLLGAY